MLRVPERSTQAFNVSFEADDDELFVPASTRYRVHDRSTGAELVAWTPILTLNERIRITVPSSANRILDDNNTKEVKVLTVQSDYGTDNQLAEEFQYLVENLSGFTS